MVSTHPLGDFMWKLLGDEHVEVGTVKYCSWDGSQVCVRVAPCQTTEITARAVWLPDNSTAWCLCPMGRSLARGDWDTVCGENRCWVTNGHGDDNNIGRGVWWVKDRQQPPSDLGQQMSKRRWHVGRQTAWLKCSYCEKAWCVLLLWEVEVERSSCRWLLISVAWTVRLLLWRVEVEQSSCRWLLISVASWTVGLLLSEHPLLSASVENRSQQNCFKAPAVWGRDRFCWKEKLSNGKWAPNIEYFLDET